ncbi:hypothetical protein GMRT_23273 [Giardia muris]|uniref:Uncharacterized protein n=1 Tax=Giardia muris TaxID=5742 RepID=A0A4Z1SRR3_GIAMU|nr:hypothetical protein GMRT_23273 [Giardia muris]|eukprot:TNJ27675.1 hypothetical protein GMRT_23273 [Giardia muris]
MRLTVALHKLFATDAGDIDFNVKAQPSERITYLSLLLRQEVAAVCEVVAAYRGFASSALATDMTRILLSVARGNAFTQLVIGADGSGLGIEFPFTSKNLESTLLAQIIRNVRGELKRNRGADTRYSISLSCVFITSRGKVTDALSMDQRTPKMTRDEKGIVYYEGLEQTSCSMDSDVAAVLMGIQQAYRTAMDDDDLRRTGRGPVIRLAITVTKQSLCPTISSSQLSHEGRREDTLQWLEAGYGVMTLYYLSLADAIDVISGASKLGLFVTPEINRPNASALFYIPHSIVEKQCLKTFDVMADLSKRGSNAWRAAGIDIFSLQEGMLGSRGPHTPPDSSVSASIHTRSRPRSRTRSFPPMESLDRPSTSIEEEPIAETSRDRREAEEQRRKQNFTRQLQAGERKSIGKPVNRAASHLAGSDSDGGELPGDSFSLSAILAPLNKSKKKAKNVKAQAEQPNSGSSNAHATRSTSRSISMFEIVTAVSSDAMPSKRAVTRSQKGSTSSPTRKVTATSAKVRKSKDSRDPREEFIGTTGSESVPQSPKRSRSPSKTIPEKSRSPASRSVSQSQRTPSRTLMTSRPRTGAMSVTPQVSSEALSFYRKLAVESDADGSFDSQGRLQLECKRLARELEETRAAKVLAEAGKNDLIEENQRLQAELDTVVANQKYKVYTIKRLERQLQDVRMAQEQQAKRESLREATHGLPLNLSMSAMPSAEPAVESLTKEIAVLRSKNDQLQNEITLCSAPEAIETLTAAARKDSDTIKKLSSRLTLLVTENRTVRTELLVARERAEVLWALRPLGDDGNERDELLHDALLLNQQYEQQLVELERAVGAADERLALYEQRQSREALLVETVNQLRAQIHQMSKRLDHSTTVTE